MRFGFATVDVRSRSSGRIKYLPRWPIPVVWTKSPVRPIRQARLLLPPDWTDAPALGCPIRLAASVTRHLNTSGSLRGPATAYTSSAITVARCGRWINRRLGRKGGGILRVDGRVPTAPFARPFPRHLSGPTGAGELVLFDVGADRACCRPGPSRSGHSLAGRVRN